MSSNTLKDRTLNNSMHEKLETASTEDKWGRTGSDDLCRHIRD